MSATKRQHHVWRSYLRSWSKDESIWFAMDGKVRKTNLMNVAQGRYFYKVGEMTEGDIKILRSMIELNSSEVIRKLAETWIPNVQLIFSLRDILISSGLDKSKVDETVDLASKQMGELYQGIIEKSGLRHLPVLLGASSFTITNDEDYIDFVYFVMTQYFRTSRIKEDLKRNFESDHPGYVDRSLGVLIPVISTLTTSSLINRRDQLIPRLVINNSGVSFITGDQPVINTRAAYTPYNSPVSDVEFYYPISPKKAVIFSDDATYSSGKINDPAIVKEFNRKISRSAELQIFAASQDELEEWKDLVGKHR